MLAQDARPGVDQRAVHREVIRGQQPLHFAQSHQRAKELPRHIRRHQPVAVVREHRRVPDGGIQRQAHEPPEQKIVIDLLHQLPLGADREKGLQKRCPKQHLRRDGGPSHPRVQSLETPVQTRQRLICQGADRPQRMVSRNPFLQPDIAEHPLRPIIPSAHRKSLQARKTSESRNSEIVES